MKIRTILQSLLFAYAMTGVLLFLLAFLVYQMEWGEFHVSAGILIIYVAASFLGGHMAGNMVRKNKLSTGFLTGLGYFLLLILVSCAVRSKLDMTLVHALTILVMCLGGGTLGSILTK